MEWWLIAFALFLYFVCALLLIAEVFVPSAGILSVLSLVSLTGGVIIFFRISTLAGWLGIGVAVVMVPVVLVISYRIFPKTRFGKSVTLNPEKRQLGEGVPDGAQLKNLMGKTGVVLTPLRPVGICDFLGQRVESVAQNGYVERGEKVRVIRINGSQVTVRTIENQEKQS